MSTEKRPRLPSTDEVFHELATAQQGVEHLAGTVLLDRYRLIKLLGSGGAAVVYRAEHTLMQKPVAVKILRPELAVRPDFVRRFLAEARTVARLRHENIVDIVDVGRTETGIVFCVMEYLEGEELAQTMDREGPMPWSRARDLVMQVCRALAAAHAAGVVHRDVKPQNCFRIRHGNNHDFVKLLDFGIAKQTDSDHGLTATGVIMGTAEYMSPEQARGSDVDARADIYSVGAMLFEMLAGRPPFEGATFIDVLVKHASEPPPRLSSLVAGVDPAIDALLARALAKRPEDRFGSIEELIAAFVVNDGRSFQGSFDGAILTVRPESVLPRASSSHQVAGVLRRLDRRTLGALALVGLVLVPGLILGVSLFERGSQDTNADEVAVGSFAEEPNSEHVDRTASDRAPPAQQASPPPTKRSDSDQLQPSQEHAPPDVGAQMDPRKAQRDAQPNDPVPVLPVPTPAAGPPAINKKKPPSKDDRRQLKKTLLAKCRDEVMTPQQLVIQVRVGANYKVMRPPKYQNLADCVRNGLDVTGLPPGDYPISLDAP